ncbi:MAG TPA: DUF5004 domain-containing protein [Flavisolibacter sp.]|jgi:hypothetical protein|nr:DUF5004 domain-containing protein [Flavisolibacter sp.]
MKRIQHFLLLLFLATLFACRTERLDAPFEPVKDVNGSWKIVGVTRNGTDLTSRYDFTKFRLNFADSAYSLSEQVPFLVNTNGTWRFDDPAYPFKISLTAKDSAAKSSSLLFPIVGGKRNMILTISPGCNANTYQYTLQKAD